MNKNGDEVTKIVYDDAVNFSEGVASVLRFNNIGNGYNWMFINKNQ
ncbi:MULTISPECIES: WG repeat-containing protein [unclassified Paenibacillus]